MDSVLTRLGLFSGRALMSAAVAVAVVAAGGAFAQSKITVSKDPGDAAMFSTVQAAVNAARPGDVIEILDAAEYAEQVTIDSAKSGITLRSKNPTGLTKPVIKYRDITNTSPKNKTEAGVAGDGPGTSGNFETCAALRVKRAKNVVLDGIAIDGGSPFVFGAANVFCPSAGAASCAALFHGNAAVSLIVAGGAQIRNCELRNAYFGVYVKDRNLGGVFGNPNPGDYDVTVPFSGFGKAGNHLLEYNRVHDNAVGFFFESSWDLGSTVRYNLIYNNYYTASTKNALSSLYSNSSVSVDDLQPGAFMFKDSYLSPIAIYNNTLNNNFANFVGHWQIGGQHLIFNNIFGQSSGTATGSNATYLVIDHKFPNRMKNSVFSIDRTSSSIGAQVQCQSNICADNPNNPYSPSSCFLADAQIGNHFAPVTRTNVTLNNCLTTTAGTTTVAQPVSMVLPGAVISGTIMGSNADGTLPVAANIRWLEMAGGTFGSGTTAATSSITLPTLFQSTDPASAMFLEPKWDDPLVINYIKNKGWADAGIRNPDGTIADLGAIPSSSAKHQTVTARIRPTDVVRVTGTAAAVSFYLSAEDGELNNPKIKYINWIYQIPDNTDKFGDAFTVVPTTSVRSITAPTTGLTSNGNNSLTFTIPALGANDASKYGFFELTVEGTDKNGNSVTSDVGFLPYRPLEYSLNMEVLKDGAVVKSIAAGEPVTLRVTPMKGTAVYTSSVLGTVEFWLNSGAAQMWIDEDTPFTTINNLTGAREYTVFFKTGGNEVIYGAGTSTVGANVLPFFGNCELNISDRYTLRYFADEGGSIEIGDQVQIVEKGANGTTVVALADDGYVFTIWSDGETNRVRTDRNVTSNKTVTAHFCVSDNIKSLRYKAGEGGAIGGPAEQSVCGGSSGYPVSAVPDEGYKFVDWDDGKKEATRSDADVTEDMEFTANFAVKTYILVYAAGENGSLIGGDTIMTVAHGSTGGPVFAQADDGYEFVAWSDGVKDNPRRDKSVSANLAATALFDTLKHTVSYIVNPKYGMLAGSAVQRVSHGLNANAVYVMGEDGYTFFEWSDGSKDSIRMDRNVLGDITVTAFFKDANGNISVASQDREIPKPGAETQAAFAPIAVTAWGEFTIGPNPVGRQSGGVSLFWRGKGIKNAAFHVYDASGNSVKKINLRDKSAAGSGKRAVGSWDLTDKRGRPVSAGTYMVKGTIKTADGKKETVSLPIGVR